MDSTQPDLFDQGGDDDGIFLANYAEQAYLDYAVSVVRGRALPEVADGQKSVQRRILYAMQAMGLGHNSSAERRVGKGVSARVDLGGRRIIKTTTNTHLIHNSICIDIYTPNHTPRPTNP